MTAPVARGLRGSVAAGAALLVLAGCAGATHHSPRGAHRARPAADLSRAAATRTTGTHHAAAPATTPAVSPVGTPTAQWRTVATVGGRTAAWVTVRAGVTLLRFDQRVAHLVLHAGSADPGPGPWAYGDSIRGGERSRLVAAFNSGFRLSTGAGGWESGGRSAVALATGRASIVTYRNGFTDIGAWRQGVPSGSSPVASVRQNLSLLVSHGAVPSSTTTCVETCWGATLGGGASVARSALGIDGQGRLVYAAISSGTPAVLAQGLLDGGVRRAAELDINPEWVAAYLFHHSGRGLPGFEPVTPGQVGIPGHFLTPDSRDFFAVLAR